MRKLRLAASLLILFLFLAPFQALGREFFDPQLIISDEEMQDSASWSAAEIQKFLIARGSFLSHYQTSDEAGVKTSAADIIAAAARGHGINPKFLLVTLQKEQGLITDDRPSADQLDWATGYGVCDACTHKDSRIQKFKGFGVQVAGAAGLMRWYYDHANEPLVRKKGGPIIIDNTRIVPGSWATAFLYTYTPHLAGNRNFARIWEAWFGGRFPNGTLLRVAERNEYWLIQDGVRRKFKNQGALITRFDPARAIDTSDLDLDNYALGSDIAFANYSLLRAASTTYLVDYDVLRPFASNAVVNSLGYNPDEVIPVAEQDIVELPHGQIISESSIALSGLIYEVQSNGQTAYYWRKDNVIRPILNRRVVEINFKMLPIARKTAAELASLEVTAKPVQFDDGTILQAIGDPRRYVLSDGKRRLIPDGQIFEALGYREGQIVSVDNATLFSIPVGANIAIAANLLIPDQKFLGDTSGSVSDSISTTMPSYLIAEYPSGRIVAGRDIDRVRPMASLTKLLTAFEAFKNNLDLNGSVKLQANNPADIFPFAPGDKLNHRDLLAAALVRSLNGAATRLSRAVGMTEAELLDRVRQRLAVWEADATTVADSTGLSPDNRSSARDLLKIFTKVAAEPELFRMLGSKSYSVKTITARGRVRRHLLQNTNQLFFDPRLPLKLIASKTGYTPEAGGTIIMLVELKNKSRAEIMKSKNQRYVIIGLGAKPALRFTAAKELITWVASPARSALAANP